jgi:PIN domain nuclease of toxin-antitoxin system
MPDAVTDTHALIWYLQDDPRLSAAAGQCFDACETDGGRIRVPSICAVEIVYLSEKGRIPSTILQVLLREFAAPDTILQFVGLDLPVVLALGQIPRTAVPDMPDRIIAATALVSGLPLITRDHLIIASGLKTIW